MTTGLNSLAKYFKEVYPFDSPLVYKEEEKLYEVKLDDESISVKPLFHSLSNSLFVDGKIILTVSNTYNQLNFLHVSTDKISWETFKTFLFSSCEDDANEKVYTISYHMDALVIRVHRDNYRISHYSSYVEKSLSFPDPSGKFSIRYCICLQEFADIVFYYEIDWPEAVDAKRLSSSFGDGRVNSRFSDILKKYYLFKKIWSSSTIYKTFKEESSEAVKLGIINIFGMFNPNNLTVRLYYHDK